MCAKGIDGKTFYADKINHTVIKDGAWNGFDIVYIIITHKSVFVFTVASFSGIT